MATVTDADSDSGTLRSKRLAQSAQLQFTSLFAGGQKHATRHCLKAWEGGLDSSGVG